MAPKGIVPVYCQVCHHHLFTGTLAQYYRWRKNQTLPECSNCHHTFLPFPLPKMEESPDLIYLDYPDT